VRTLLTRAMSALTRVLLRLRYRIEVRGLDDIVQRGQRGILFLPNHSALIDPVVMVALLHRHFAPRPLADEYQVTRTAFGRVALLFGSRVLPSLDREGAQGREKTRAALAGVIDDLKAGENILLYPAGRIKRGIVEDIGSASGTETIIKGAPEARVVLVRHNGLWGSSFSFGAIGRMPDFGSALWRGFKGMLLSGIFFMPRRPVTIEFVEPDDVPRRSSRQVLNRYLERFYNAHSAPNTYVPLSIWETGGVCERPEPVYAVSDSDSSGVATATRDLVVSHLRAATGVKNIGPSARLAQDLGMDSLASAELVAWIEQEFGFSVGTPESLRTVADVVLAAAGQGISALATDLKPIPAAWFASRANQQRVVFPPGDTITSVVLRQAAAGPSRPILADQTSGLRTYRDLITGVYVLKPILEAMPGEHVGIMLPASVGASVLTLAAMFAGKTAVMVNWTTGVRTIRHSLELLGVSRVITAKALLAKLTTLGLDMGDLTDRFVYVEDLMSGVTTGQKIRAALHARFSWSALERVTPRDHAVVLFTSGSESVPKAVPLSHLNLLTNSRDILQMGQLVENDVLLGMLPPFHSFGLTTTVLLPLCCGLRTVYHSNPTESALLARLIEAYRVSILFATPTFLGGIVRLAEDRQLASLRLAVTGAERCPDALNATLKTRLPRTIVLEGYGITECSPVVSASPMDAPVPGSIGRLLAHVEGVVVDLGLTRRVAPNENGMLLVRGPSVFSGYLHHTGDSPFVEFEGQTWYRTGDLVRMTTEGILYFEGRLKRFVKLGGEMISLPAIESVLQRQLPDSDRGPAVAVEAIGNPDSPDIVLFTTIPIDRAQANAQIKQAGLSALHNIRRVVQVEAIPVLGTGKTDYRSLRAREGRSTG
jgi:acyl-CoA synthetase (AMP-forming)/AMP-acid ligase II/1-acyl-sn-glycerol-3-phosphate acyltransferase/acyl carrier protein